MLGEKFTKIDGLTGSVTPSPLFPRDSPSIQPIFDSILKPLLSRDIDLQQIIIVFNMNFIYQLINYPTLLPTSIQ